MKRISIYNNNANNHQNRRGRISKMLKEHGFTPISNGEIVIVIGGDGTFLSAVKERYKENPLFVGLNSGNLGFFSEFPFSDAKKLIQAIASKEYEVVEYPLYEVEIVQKNGYVHREIFLNDISIERGVGTNVIFLETTINHAHKFNFAADAVLLSTSLGSGAYNMAANGAVSLDWLPTFQLTAVAQQRNKKYRGITNPILMSHDAVLEFVPDHKTKRPFRVVADGREIKARQPQRVRIFKSGKTFKVIRTHEFDYSTNVIEKLF